MSRSRTSEAAASAVGAGAREALASEDMAPFSPGAFTTLTGTIEQFIKELIDESVKVSRRHRADTVSSNHVQRASEYLVLSTSRRIHKHLGTLGGILLGSAVSNFLSLTAADNYNIVNVLFSAGLGMTGAFFIAWHIAKE